MNFTEDELDILRDIRESVERAFGSRQSYKTITKDFILEDEEEYAILEDNYLNGTIEKSILDKYEEQHANFFIELTNYPISSEWTNQELENYAEDLWKFLLGEISQIDFLDRNSKTSIISLNCFKKNKEGEIVFRLLL